MNTFLISCFLVVLCCWGTNANSLAFRSDVEEKNLQLANKLEKRLVLQNSPLVQDMKYKLEERIRQNFLRALVPPLIARGVPTKEIIILSDHLDFQGVVDDLPFLLREPERARNVESLLQYVQQTHLNDDEDEDEESSVTTATAAVTATTVKSNVTTPTTPTTTKSQVEKILDSASQININEISSFLKEIPQIFQGVESIIDGVDEYFD